MTGVQTCALPISALAQDRFENGLAQVDNGEMTAEEFKKALTQFQLTESQTKQLELL